MNKDMENTFNQMAELGGSDERLGNNTAPVIDAPLIERNTRPAPTAAALETIDAHDFNHFEDGELVTRSLAEAYAAGLVARIAELEARFKNAQDRSAYWHNEYCDRGARMLQAETRAETAEAELAKARETLTALDAIITSSINENGSDHHRMKIGDKWYDGPPVDAAHRILMGLRKVVRAALKPGDV